MNALKFFLNVSIILSLLAGCAGRRSTEPPPYVDNPSGPNATQWPGKDSDYIPPGERPSERKDEIALVVGGAGVTSFATIGLLKRFKEEGIRVRLIVATGWPVLFALGYGGMKSVHDLEWQASRLHERDFRRVCDLNPEDELPKGKISEAMARFFPPGQIEKSSVPVVVSQSAGELGAGQTIDHGPWQEPLIRSLAVPGLYRDMVPGDEHWLRDLKGVNVEEALRRHSGPVIVVNMYEDFRRYLIGRSGSSEKGLFTQAYILALQKGLKEELGRTPLVGQVQLGVSPTDFSAKRAAIQAGYREAKRLARLLQ